MNQTIKEESNPNEIEIEAAGPVFSTPVYIQRYTTVRDILLMESKIEKVVDFGCAEGKFFKYLQKLPNVREISLVDVLEDSINSASCKARPLAWDYLFKRKHPLTVKLFLGNVAKPDIVLQNYDAVTCIELIEHLTSDVLNDFPRSIFEFIQPKIAILTTPNSDFNVLFPGLNGFRHWDHKFEWSRDQFKEWCHNIINLYRQYTVEFLGVGDPPEESKHLGYCTQIAVFRNAHTNSIQNSEKYSESYILIEEHLYPGQNV